MNYEQAKKIVDKLEEAYIEIERLKKLLLEIASEVDEQIK